MSERWVKATLDPGGHVIWVNMALVESIEGAKEEEGGSWVSFVAGHSSGDLSGAMLVKEPPEHFLPPLTVGADQITAFVRRLAFMEDSETIKPDGTAIVREARRLIEELREAETKDWVIRTYGGIRAPS